MRLQVAIGFQWIPFEFERHLWNLQQWELCFHRHNGLPITRAERSEGTAAEHCSGDGFIGVILIEASPKTGLVEIYHPK